jgi:mRNA-degrading endonuclease RelE of RelBE toxin-antitoxin system
MKSHNRVMARVTLEAAAAGQFVKRPARIKPRVERLFVRLADWPRVSGAKPLRGRLAGRFRMRTGDYRVQFRVEGVEVVVERIGHRDGYYEG